MSTLLILILDDADKLSVLLIWLVLFIMLCDRLAEAKERQKEYKEA